MKAIIFAAGLGTRLQPHTNNKPKALVEINHTTLLEIQIRKLIKFGCDEIVVNVHHFSSMVKAFLKSKAFNLPIHISDETDQLLDTGGGLLKARSFLDGTDPFLAINVDVLTNLQLNNFFDFHSKSQAFVSLAVRKRPTSRYLLFDEHHILCGWENINTKEQIIVDSQALLKPLAFSGIHVINPAIFELIPNKGKFSIIPEYLNLAKAHKIIAYQHDEDFWMDVGKADQLEDAGKMNIEDLI